MFHKFDICGWHDGVSVDQIDRCTEISPDGEIPEARIDGQPYPNFTGYVWVDLIYPGTAMPIAEEVGI